MSAANCYTTLARGRPARARGRRYSARLFLGTWQQPTSGSGRAVPPRPPAKLDTIMEEEYSSTIMMYDARFQGKISFFLGAAIDNGSPQIHWTVVNLFLGGARQSGELLD